MLGICGMGGIGGWGMGGWGIGGWGAGCGAAAPICAPQAPQNCAPAASAALQRGHAVDAFTLSP